MERGFGVSRGTVMADGRRMPLVQPGCGGVAIRVLHNIVVACLVKSDWLRRDARWRSTWSG
jgi:hypothetical protein